jgi:peroxiredoxin
MSSRAALGIFLLCASCAGAGARSSADALHALAPQGAERFTVVMFFSADCHVLRAHDERVRELAAEYGARGVRFLALDPEVGATEARDRDEASRRGYPFPILVDEGARLAKAYGAEYAGHAVVLDRAGAVLYRGGIDSDRVHLTNDATPYLRNALADLVAGRPPSVAGTKVLGCALRTW